MTEFPYQTLHHMKQANELLERIAVALETLVDPNKPVNVYGEGLSEAIQNSIARGLQGINTADLRR